MAEIFQLKHSGEQIDALLDKAETAVQPIPDGDGNTYLMADGLVTSEDTHYYFPNKAPANDPAHTFAMASEVQATDAKLTELSAETSAKFERSAESVAERFEGVDTEIEQLKRGEAYVFGETLAFRNYADAKVKGNTLTL